MPTSRISSFEAALRVRGSTITKGEAEKALKKLHGSAAGARIVSTFLGGAEARALSPKAKEALVDFVKKNAAPAGGDHAVNVKAAARDEAHQAERNLAKAQARLEQLIQTPRSAGTGLQQVLAWLDAAEADVMEAKAKLKKLAGDAAARSASKDLDGARSDIGKAAEDVAQLIARAKGGGVKKADLEEVRGWLQKALPDLSHADTALDNGHWGPPPIDTSLKFPSDQEDGGGGGAVFHTNKFPSDNEDGGGHGVGPIDAPKDAAPNDAAPNGDHASAVSSSRKGALKKAFDKLNAKGSLAWKSGGVQASHAGVRFATVALGKDKHTDGYAYTAFIPLGARTPTAPQRDPNQVNEFYVERTGGKRGTTEAVGPLKLG